MKTWFGLYLGSLLLIATSPLFAQSYLYETGNPTFSTTIPIENGFINVNSGNIHMEIPLATHAQRGRLSLEERLIYDSRIWKIVNNSGSYSWQPTNVPNSMGGWRFSSGMDTGSTTYGVTFTQGTCDDGTSVSQTNYSRFVWTDPSGTNHVFNGRTYGYGTHPHSCVVHPQLTTVGNAVDGSGYSMSVSNYTNMTIKDGLGNQVYPTPTDTNGNFFSKDANGNLIDTLGRTPVLTSTNGNLIYYDVLGYNGAHQRYTVTTQTVSYHTSFGQSAVSEASGSFTAIQSIQLPDGSTYSFTYDSGTSSGNYGELMSVKLPAGGTVSYTYSNFVDSFQNANRWVHSRTKDGALTGFQPTTISNCSGGSGCQEKIVVTSPANNDTVYTFSLPAGSTDSGKSWVVGIDAYQGFISNGTRLAGSNTSYTYTAVSIPFGPTYNLPATITTKATLYDVSLATQTLTTMDSTGSRPVSLGQWDYFSSLGSPPATPTIQTNYQYAFYSYPSNITVVDGSGNKISETVYGYDETSGTGHAALQTTSGLSNHTTVTASRANLTTVSKWIDGSGATLSTEGSYDDAGTLLTSTDPNGQRTYGHDASDAFTTSTTLPTPPSGVVLNYTASIDSQSGLVTLQTDPNGTQDVPQGYDALGRPTGFVVSNGANTYAKSSFSYSPNQLSEYNYQNSSVYADSETLYDSYGRVSRVAVSNGQSTNPYYQVDTCYDSSGRVGFQSYRYQGAGFGTSKVCSGTGDAYTYDALNRIKTISHGDGTSIQYSYAGRATKVVDEMGATRISQVNSLGRTTTVCEISSNASMPGGSGSPANCGTDISGTGFSTSFAYDLANHKATVTQGVQSRIFQTDWLGRSTSTTEPETGQTTFSYAYNATGLVVTRQSPKANQTSPSVTATKTVQYDALSRVVGITYTDGTPAKTFAYDTSAGWSGLTQTNLLGRLSLASVSNAKTAYSYDPIGRVKASGECGPSNCGSSYYSTTYSYDWLGNLLTSADGSGTTDTYTYTPANELLSITSSWNDSTHPPNLVSSVNNGPFGPVNWQLGNGLTAVRTYNTQGRVQGGWICSGSSQAYCTGGTQRYGFTSNWLGSYLTGACDTALNQCNSYNYDSFGRLSSLTVNSGSPGSYSYVYDRWGNRWQQNEVNGSGGPQPQLSFNTATNQIGAGGYTYDAAGNMTYDGFHSYTYDADGNMTQVDIGNTATFTYDALNRRIRIDKAGSSKEYIFNPDGQRTSAWDVGNNWEDEGWAYWGAAPVAFYAVETTHFQHQDWIGTVRLRTAYDNQTEGSFASLPFGDGFSFSGSDFDHVHFAGLEHDYVSNTDHAQFRQYNPAPGRWMSPDPFSGSYDFSNPQSLNRYAYVSNNPLSLTDPSGLIDGSEGCIGGPWGCVIGIAAAAFFDHWLFGGGPSFHGSLHPRPTTGDPNWDGNFGESLGIGTKVPQTNLGIAAALGLPTAGCEFGACGGMPESFSGSGGEYPCNMSRDCSDDEQLASDLGFVAHVMLQIGKNGLAVAGYPAMAPFNCKTTHAMARISGWLDSHAKSGAAINAGTAIGLAYMHPAVGAAYGVYSSIWGKFPDLCWDWGMQ
jgi:RHS repeat-associated protein